MCGFSCSNGPLSGEERAKKVLGHAAVSLAGHDSGKIYLVTGIANPGERGEMLLLSDGRTRRFSCPKAKKTKHVRVLPFRSAKAAELLLSGMRVDDSVIVHSLKEAAGDASPEE